MRNEDTIKLLEEVNEGIKMGVSAIDDVLKKVGSAKLDKMLREYRDEHSHLGDETHALLNELDEKTKEPPVVAKIMSSIKTEVRLAADNSDAVAAEIITDGCNTGIKALSKYLNECSAADVRARDIARQLIDLETDMMRQLRAYL